MSPIKLTNLPPPPPFLPQQTIQCDRHVNVGTKFSGYNYHKREECFNTIFPEELTGCESTIRGSL